MYNILAIALTFSWDPVPATHADGEINVIDSCAIVELRTPSEPLNPLSVLVSDINPFQIQSVQGGEKRYDGAERAFKMTCSNSAGTSDSEVVEYHDIPKQAPRLGSFSVE